MWKNIEKDTIEIVYDNKNLHITELEDTWPMFILFYLLVIKDNDPVGLGETIIFSWLNLRPLNLQLML